MSPALEGAPPRTDDVPEQDKTSVRLPFLDAVKDLLLVGLDARLAPGINDYLDLFCDDGVLEIPYAPGGSTSRVEGRTKIAVYLETLRNVTRLADMTLKSAHSNLDGEVVVLEYDGTVCLERKGEQFRQSYISVLKIRNGRIALWREYTNPLAGAAAAPSYSQA